MARWIFPSSGPLRVEIDDETVEFIRRGRPADVLRRADIELVVIQEDNGVGGFMVYGPGEAFLGAWETNWIVKPPQLVMRVLKRHGYPYALTTVLYRNRLFYRHPGRQIDGPVA